MVADWVEAVPLLAQPFRAELGAKNALLAVERAAEADDAESLNAVRVCASATSSGQLVIWVSGRRIGASETLPVESHHAHAATLVATSGSGHQSRKCGVP